MTSRWRRPWASQKLGAMRVRKRSIETSPSSSAAIEVIATSGSPQATTHEKGSRSLSTLIANPCVETPRETWTPSEAILRSSTHTPV